MLWVTGGGVLTAIGLAVAARAGTESTQDPVFAGSPLVFALGLSVLITTGAVYELWPERL
jgi:hypothetical protein